MKKILFYTLLIVLFVNCRKVEAKKDPIEGTWRFHEVFTENLSINQKLSCFNENARNWHNLSKIYMNFRRNKNSYFNFYYDTIIKENNISKQYKGEAQSEMGFANQRDSFCLLTFYKKTKASHPKIELAIPGGGDQMNINCKLINSKEMICENWIVKTSQQYLVDCQNKPISNITLEQLQYRFKKD